MDGEEGFFFKPLPGGPGGSGAPSAPSGRSSPAQRIASPKQHAAPPSSSAFPAFPASLSSSPAPSSSSPRPAPPGTETIMPQGLIYGPFPTAFPRILHYRITEKEWKDIVKKVNDLWNPVVEESRRIAPQQGVISMTILGVPLTYAKEHKFRSLRKEANKSITTYLSQVNGMLSEKRISFTFQKTLVDATTTYCLQIEVKGT